MNAELELIAEHRYELRFGQVCCLCGWAAPNNTPGEHAAHVVSRLSEHGYSIVQLPKPTDNGGGQCMVWRSELLMLDWHAEARHLTGYLTEPGSFNDITAEQARQIGLAFLAAAAAAEEDQ